MSTLEATFDRLKGLLLGQAKASDPLKEALIRRIAGAAAVMAAIVVAWLLLASLVFSKWIYAPSKYSDMTDSVLQEASESISEVVAFANSAEPVTEETLPTAGYPAAINVAPVEVARNPFMPIFAAPAKPGADLGDLIRAKQQKPVEPEVPFSIRGILSSGGTYLAVLSSGERSRVVRQGDTFVDWEVLAVGRDRVLLKKDGKTRTIEWEGNN